jgi:hypothetical protein
VHARRSCLQCSGPDPWPLPRGAKPPFPSAQERALRALRALRAGGKRPVDAQ